jgi:hypothetical protein
MFDFLHSGFGDPAFTRRRLDGLLDKAVQHDDSPADKGAEKHARDTFGTFQPKLEQAFTEGFGVRLSEVGTERDNTTGQHDVPGSESDGQVQDVRLHILTVVSDRVVHGDTITNMLPAHKQA